MYYPRSLVTAEPEDEDDSAPLLDVVVREEAPLLQLHLVSEQPLPVRGDPLLVLQRIKVKDSRAQRTKVEEFLPGSWPSHPCKCPKAPPQGCGPCR